MMDMDDRTALPPQPRADYPGQPGIIVVAGNPTSREGALHYLAEALPRPDTGPKPVRVTPMIMHVPTVRIACPCGANYDNSDKRAVKMAQRGDALPDMQCACGRMLQPKRSGILDAKGRAV